jgi:hypothetical protein
MLRFPTENLVEQGVDGGMYIFKICGQKLRVIASAGLGWDHISVSHKKRCPTWHEMCRIKDIFFDDEDIVLQFHPPKKNYINIHPFCLHLWRNQNDEIKLPPMILV